MQTLAVRHLGYLVGGKKMTKVELHGFKPCDFIGGLQSKIGHFSYRMCPATLCARNGAKNLKIKVS